jgi:hypothetical protein
MIFKMRISLGLLRVHVLVQMKKSSETRSAHQSAPGKRPSYVSLKTLSLLAYFTLWASK